MSDINGFCDEVETALANCIDDAAPKMAKKYGLDEAAVAMALPRLFLKAGVKHGLKDRGWDDDEIETLVHHFFMFLNGAQQWRED